MQVIIIAGQAKSGKSYLASLIAEEVFRLGYIPIIDNFAAPIKEEAASLGLDKVKDHDPFRKFCQDFGKMKRSENPEFFVEQAAKRLSNIANEEAKDISEGRKHWERVVIFDDCRYPNECKFGKAVDGILMFVSRQAELPQPKAEWREHESEHMSRIVDNSGFETHFDEVFDVFLMNDSKKSALGELVKAQTKNWMSANHPSFGSCTEDDCACPLCVCRREGTLPDPTDVLEYILRKLTGQEFTPEQLEQLEDQIDMGGTPRIDIDFTISFEDDEDEEE